MPWLIVKIDDGYFVVNQHTGKKMSRRPLPKERAKAQLRALHANVHDYKEREAEKSIKFGRRYRRGAWGNMQGLAKHLAKKYGGDPHFFTKVFNSEELQRVVQYRGKPYTKQQKAKIAALAHKYVTGIWPGEHRGKNPHGREKEFEEMEDAETLKGGPGSGNRGHAGRPGHVGGSMPTKNRKGGAAGPSESAVTRKPGRTARGQRRRSRIDPDVPVTEYPKRRLVRAKYSEDEKRVAYVAGAFRSAIKKYPTQDKAAQAHNKYDAMIRRALLAKGMTKSEIDEDQKRIEEDLSETSRTIRSLVKKRDEAFTAFAAHVQARRESGRDATPADHPSPKPRREYAKLTYGEEAQARSAKYERSAIREFPTLAAATRGANKYRRLITKSLLKKGFTKNEVREDMDNIADDLSETNPTFARMTGKLRKAVLAGMLHIQAQENRAKRTARASASKEAGSILVFKEKSGNYRWISISSNAFRDRDREIVSLKALEADVERADRDHDYGPLRWWHMDGAEIGDADFNMIYGRTLIESGTFRRKEYAEAVQANSDKLRISIGFRHPVTEPDHEGVFSTIRRFERSVLPRDAASNPLTGILVTRS